MRWRRNIKAFGLVDKTWQQVMDRRRRKLTVKKMMRRMKSRKIHSRKRSAGETGMEGEDKRDLTAADGEEAAFKDIIKSAHGSCSQLLQKVCGNFFYSLKCFYA
ncbi:unnamed protein product [Brassica oleracea]